MTMDLFAPKKSALLILSFAAGFWYVGCSSTPASTPPNNGGRSNVGGGSHSNAGGSGQGGNTNVGYQFSGGATSVTSGTGTSHCAGNNCSVVDAGPYCGDKVIRTDLDENCDDGNRVGGDGCSGICKKEANWECPTPGEPCKSLIVCGNGVRQTGEGCDDGNKSKGDGCDDKCNAEAGWYCAPSSPDDPTSKSECKKLANCGDGRVTAGETCDLGADNNGKGKGCDAQCQKEDGWVCRPTGCVHQSVCGNRQIEDGEQCDDGNPNSDDGCSSSCQKEASYYDCSTPGAPCIDTSQCGNGVLEKSELCDDHNTESGDGCTKDCQVEDGFQCRMAGQACVPRCGDSKMVGSEKCDDGNKDNEDGCSITCLVEPGYTCKGTGPNSCTKSICGDGIVDANESCDAGEKNGLFYGVGGKGCSKTCTKEPDCRPNGTTQACSNVCGDGNKSPDEECDDGNTFSGDGCSDKCVKEEGFDCKDETLTDEEDCPSDKTLKCIVLPVTYRDFEGQQVTGGHTDFFYMGAAVTGGRTVGVTTGAKQTTCVPNAAGKKLAFAAGDACPNSDQSGPCTELVKPALDAEGKPVMNKDSCACVFTDWDRTGVLGTCPTSGTGDCTPATGLSTVKDCWVDGEGSHRLRVDDTVKMFQSADSFKQWYRDDTNVAYGRLELAKTGSLYQFSSSITGDPAGSAARTRADDIHDICLKSSQTGTLNSGFFPIEDAGGSKICNVWPYWLPDLAKSCCAGSGCPVPSQWDALGCPTDPGPVPSSGTTSGKVTGVKRNFYMTTEVRYLFRYDGKAGSLEFFGDDDVWVFVNGKLAVDLGGTHEQLRGTVAINATTFGLTSGNTYEIAVFHADRNPVDSNYQLTLSGFNTVRTSCGATCGDGKVTGGEECDLGPGKNTGEYGGCNDDCTYAPFCGDGKPDKPQEQCDDGKNTTVTSTGTTSDACGPGCTLPPRCGDGDIQTGEECDDGVDGNVDDQCAGCNTQCKKNPFCGDQHIDDQCGETCDDGVNIGGYGFCLDTCQPDSYCGDKIVDKAYGEKCDEGKDNSNDPGAACNKTCGVPAVCGDGVVQSPETCDGINDGTYGNCTVDCQQAAYCGDGVKNGTNEECDYGDDKHGNGNAPMSNAPYGSCLENCKLGPRCGDGTVQSSEACDLGLLNSQTSQCSTNCTINGGVG